MSEVLDIILNATPAAEVAPPPVIERKPENIVAKPPMFAVILHNDQSSNPTFVMNVLSSAFSISNDKASQLMMQAHFEGKSVVKITTRDTAETQHQAAVEMTRSAVAGQDYFVFPDNTGGTCELKFTVEPETAGEA